MEEELEEQKEALERDYHQKMQKMREELEKKNEEDKARFVQELEDLKQQMEANSQSENSNSRCDSEDDVQRNSAYELMQSIVFTPLAPRKWSLSLNERVVEGRERDTSLSPQRSSTSPDIDDSFSSSNHSPYSSPGSSPANKHRKTTIIQRDIDEDTLGVDIVKLPESPNSVEMGFHLISAEDGSPTFGDHHRGAVEDVDSGAGVSTPTISTTSV